MTARAGPSNPQVGNPSSVNANQWKSAMNRLLAIATVSLLMTLGYHAQTSSDGYPKIEIFGGSPLSASNRISKYLAAVRLVKDGQNEICTGISIQPQIVLTAAHCADGEMSSMQVVFSPDGEDQDASQLRSVVAIKVPTHFDQQDALNTPGYFYDIALLKLDSPAPEGTLQMQLPDESVDESTIAIVDIAGYGASSFDGDTSVAQGLDERLRMAVVHTRTAIRDNVLEIDQTKGKGACVGDSGGPAFAPSGPGFVVLGTLIDLDRSNGEACRGIANYLDIITWIQWIEGNSFNLMQTDY